MHQNTLILGAQWGDEGKGKITHWLAQRARVVARYAGGNNAGHTVVFGGETYKLHQIPSGIFHPGVTCILGNGMVIDPQVLLEEMDSLTTRGVALDGLRISLLAHLILPYHRWLDGRSEDRLGARSIGTTRRGIGPAYADKISRTGIRMIDLLDPQALRSRLELSFSEKAHALTGSGLELEAVHTQLLAHAERLRPYLADTSALLCEHHRKGDRILFEGAQGALLDIDLGTYPYVTSSNAGPGYAGAGLGVPPRAIERVLGVAKAYATRVGAGPFPTELQDATGERMRQAGGEFGTTTGRPRRCGWIDLVALRTVCRIHGVDALALTKLDVLDGFEQIRAATAYRLDGTLLQEIPLSSDAFERCEPVYEDLEGWAQLPSAARAYVRRIEAVVGVPVEIVSVGPEDTATIVSAPSS
ncbi:MAG: adenylosuccinate synthase [Proteobacteria bacterium]|nr:adenylosuccinate synthase [Pseudomonadota bacterium]